MNIQHDHCVTCGDVAVIGEVVEVRQMTATVAVDGGQEQVGIELVAPVERGDLLLCHAGIALERVEQR